MFKAGGRPCAEQLRFCATNYLASVASNARVAFLTNFLPPYRLPVLHELSEKVGVLKTFVSTTMEANRDWSANIEGLNVELQRTFSRRRFDRHPSGFTQETYFHLPYDTLLKLRQFRPDVVISGEMGIRTMQAVLYRIAVPSSRLIVHADLSEHTELGRGRERIRRWISNHADAIIVNGRSGARYMRTLDVPDRKIFTVPYATDTTIYSNIKRRNSAESTIRLLHVGQLIERKGVVPFLELLCVWAKNNPQKSLNLTLVGNGPLRPALEAIERPPNLTLEIIDSVKYTDMPSVYAGADIFVLPTLADSWGLVVNEAMAAGLPILGSIRSQAVEDLVLDRTNGWTFKPDDLNQIFTVFNAAFSHSHAELAEIGERGRKIAHTINPHHAADKTMLAIESCFQSLPNRRRIT